VWFDPGFGFYESVPLTLPSDTATQNLILLVLAKRRNPDDDWTKRKFRSRREITRKLGVNHSGSRNATLYKAMNHARQWFEKHDGELKWKYLRNGKVLFKFQRPFAEPQPVQVVGRCHA